MSANRLTFWGSWAPPMLYVIIIKTMEVDPIISLNGEIQVTGDLSLIPLSRSLDEANLNKEFLKAILEKAQDQLIEELCGKKYARNTDKKFQRAGTTQRTLVTRYGTIKFKLVKVKSLENGTILRPFLLYLGLGPRKRVVDDLDFECAELATLLTYRDSQTVIRNLTKAEVPKHRIHSYVQKVGAFIDEERRKEDNTRTDLLYADGTKTHGLNQKKNEINVVVGKDAKTGEKSLLGLTVNKEWRETAKQVKTQAEILVADADKPLRSALLDKALNYQLCVNHSVREVSMHLWKAGLPKNERKEILRKLRAILHTCRNSVLKHLKDGDVERLKED